MRKAILIVAIPALALLQALPAFADMGHFRALIEENIRIEEGRTNDLNRLSATDARLAKEIMESARQRDAEAKIMADRADEMRQEASYAGPGEKRELETFANELQLFSKHDRDQMAEKRQAADILDRQAKEAAQGVRDHRERIQRMRERLAHMENHHYE